MSNPRELEESLRAVLEASRRRLGGPPSSEKLLAYHHGGLSAAEADRIREHLVHDPRLLDRFLDLAAHAGAPGDPDHLSGRELGEDWAVVRRRLGCH